MNPNDLVGNRRPAAWHRAQATPGVLHRLAHCVSYLVRLAGSHTNASIAIAHGDQGIEGEPPTAFDDLRHTVDRHDILDQVRLALAAVAARRALFPYRHLSELQSAFARALGDRLDPPVKRVATPVEDDALDPLLPSPLR